MSHAQEYHAATELKAQGLTATQVHPLIERGKLAPALTPLVTALGGTIIDSTDTGVRVRIKPSSVHSWATFGGLVVGLARHAGAGFTKITPRTVHIEFRFIG
jgi:hypothetical protein